MTRSASRPAPARRTELRPLLCSHRRMQGPELFSSHDGGHSLPAADPDVLVVIPAHREAESIGPAVLSVRVAAATAGVRARVIVVADACGDATAERAERAGAVVITIAAGAVGAARAAGFTYGLEHVTDARQLWLATTDADSAVPSDWLLRQAAHRRAGAEVVLGTVQLEPIGGPDPLGASWARDYALGLDGDGHRHIHGANLAFTAAAYCAVGGFRPLPTDEDVDLVARFRAAAVSVRTAIDMPVRTSRRTTGRAPRGFATTLEGLAR